MMDEKAIFEQALQISSDTEREAFLEQACGDEQEFRARLATLLLEYEKLDSFLEAPAWNGIGDALSKLRSSPFPTGRIGPYQLIQTLGKGGMGMVYLAEQLEPVQRQVALKVIRPWAGTWVRDGGTVR